MAPMRSDDPGWTVIGMLSGTSHDAVDAAVARVRLEPSPDGGSRQVVLRPLGLHTEPFPEPLRDLLLTCLPPSRTSLADVCRLDTGLGRFFGAVAARARAGPGRGAADLVVSHGQTVYHWVADGRARGTLQLGAPAWIAEATGLPVVSDLRTRDIARGGQGAPLASLLDALLLLDGPGRGALNLGGIANLTARDRRGELTACDLGPAGALIDAAARAAGDGTARMDTGGARAARGTVHAGLLRGLLREPYYRLPPPKSTGKELFHAAYLRHHTAGRDIPGDDVVATVTELTALLVARACRELGLRELTAAGGGVRNPVLMARIRARAPGTRVSTTDDHGIPAQAKEGYLFALLGFLTAHGLAGTLPVATGATAPAVLGSLTPGAAPLRLPAPERGPLTGLRVEH